MANIAEYLARIKSAIYGEEVRGSIHDSIQAINSEVIDYNKEYDQKISEASKFAANAENSATNAATSEINASTSAAVATEAANSASASATAAIESASLSEDSANLSKQYMEEAKKASETSNVEIATTDRAGIVKPDGISIEVSDNGRINVKAKVAETNSYEDLDNKPDLKAVAMSNSYEDLDNKPDVVDRIAYNDETNELTIYAGEKAISSASIISGSSISLHEPTNASAVAVDEEITIKWTDPDDLILQDVTLAKWAGTLVVRKLDSAPTNKSDGTIIIDSKVKNQYSVNGFKDTVGLENGNKYYYGIFPYSEDKAYTTTVSVSATPQPIYPDAATDITAIGDDAQATITYTLPSDITSATLYWHTENTVNDAIYTGSMGISGTSAVVTGLANDTEYFFTIYTANAKGRKTKSAVVSATPKSLKIVTFADGTWEEIGKMLEAHYAGKIDIADYWAVGDTKTGVKLSAMSATGVGESHAEQTCDLVIIGIKHDDLVSAINGKTKSAITLQLKNCLNEKGYMNSSYGLSDARWTTSKRRTWMSSVFEPALLSEIRSLIKTVSKNTEYPINTSNTLSKDISNERCFLLSSWEIFGEATHVNVQDGNQYQYYTTASNRIKKVGSSNYAWFSRTSFYWDGYGRFITSYTNGSYNWENALSSIGICPAFCL